MSEEVEKILSSYLKDNDSLYYKDKIITGYSIDNIAMKIVELYTKVEKRASSMELENEKLKTQIEMKDNLINMYENIISKSNFSVIVDKKKKVSDKE